MRSASRSKALALLLLAGPLAAPAPALAQIEQLLGPPTQPAPGPEPAGAIAAEGAPRDDAILGRLRDVYGAIEGLEGVEPQVRAGVVILGGRAPDAAAAEAAAAVARRVEGVVTVVDRVERAATPAETLAPGVRRLGDRLEEALRALPLIGVALAILALFLLAGAALARRRRLFERLTPNAFLAELAAQAARIALALVGVVVALDFIGATALLGAILGAAGILGLALGFAVRDTIENYVASVLLSLRRPFAPNDFVSIEGREGFVVSLTARATVLLTAEGNHVRIPNATVFRGVIVNYTARPERRFDFALGVNADAPLGRALTVGREAMAGLDFLLSEPRPGGWIETVGDSNVVLRFVGWIDQTGVDFLQARSEAIRVTKLALEAAGFELPEPIYRLRMEEAGAARGAPAEAAPAPRAPESAALDVARLGAVEERAAAERAGREDLLSAGAARE